MPFRLLAIFAILAPAGCVSPRVVINRGEEKPVARPQPAGSKFGEFKPGQVVVKNPAVTPSPTNPDMIWPTRNDVPVPVEPSKLLTPPPAIPVDPPLVNALRDYLEGRTDKSVERIRDLDPANQELILRLLPALAQAGKAELGNRASGDAVVLVSQLESANEAASKLCPLVIRNACFVWRVSQFGVYEPVPEKHPFLPGGSGVLYLELQNAPSLPAELPAGGRGYTTRLTCSHHLADANGKPLAAPRTQPHAEFTRSRVRDYFLKIEFEVPSAPGIYSLVVELKDDATGRKVKRSVPLRVGT